MKVLRAAGLTGDWLVRSPRRPWLEVTLAVAVAGCSGTQMPSDRRSRIARFRIRIRFSMRTWTFRAGLGRYGSIVATCEGGSRGCSPVAPWVSHRWLRSSLRMQLGGRTATDFHPRGTSTTTCAARSTIWRDSKHRTAAESRSTEWAVDDYENTNPNDARAIGLDTSADTTTNVALWLALHAPVYAPCPPSTPLRVTRATPRLAR
jgi:hypothetical protein